jgi:hypothetical protein
LSDDLLTVSSILLTPPLEDDSHVNSSRFHNPHSITRNPLVLHDCNMRCSTEQKFDHIEEEIEDLKEVFASIENQLLLLNNISVSVNSATYK